MKKIGTRLIVGNIALCLGISIVIGGISGAALYRNARDGMYTSVSICAQGYEDAIAHAIDVFMTKAESAAQSDAITDPEKSLNLKTAILGGLASQLGFLDIGVADQNGDTYNGANILDREYFQNAIKGNTYISSPLVRKTTGATVLFVAAKIVNNTGYNGIVYCGLDYNTFSQMIYDATIGKKGYAFLVDKTGTVIAHPDGTLVSNFVNFITLAESDPAYQELAAVVEKMKAKETGIVTIKHLGQRNTIAYRPVEGTDGWSLAIVADTKEMVADFYTNLYLLIGLCVIALIVGIVVAYFRAKSISDPIVKLTRRLEQLSKGDLQTAVPETRKKDEILTLTISLKSTIASLNSYIKDIDQVLSGIAEKNIAVKTEQEYLGDFAPIKSSLTLILDALNETMSEIKTSAEQVASGAGQISDNAQSLASGATEQASAVEELFSTFHEISDHIKKTSQNANEAAEIAKGSLEKVERGNLKMQEMIQAMERINEASNKIGVIIKTIEDIAFQTNILALNASVEAARAGNAGKGFAVVANEVKVLAAKSTDAVKDTTAMIQAAIEAAENGKEIALETAGYLSGIVQESKDSAALIEKISVAAEEQSESVTEVTKGVEQISNVIQMNSSTAEESAAASEELSGQAQIMKQLVSCFKLRAE